MDERGTLSGENSGKLITRVSDKHAWQSRPTIGQKEQERSTASISRGGIYWFLLASFWPSFFSTLDKRLWKINIKFTHIIQMSVVFCRRTEHEGWGVDSDENDIKSYSVVFTITRSQTKWETVLFIVIFKAPSSSLLKELCSSCETAMLQFTNMPSKQKV